MIKVETSLLNEALKKVAPAVAAKEDVLSIKLNGHRMMINACDGSSAASTIIECEQEGENTGFWIEHSVLSIAVAELSKVQCEESVVCMDKGNELKISRGDSKMSLPISPEESCKKIVPPDKTTARACTIDGHWMRKALLSASRRAEVNGSAITSNVYFRMMPDEFEAGGTDGKAASILFHCPYVKGQAINLLDKEEFLDVIFLAARAKAIAAVLEEDEDVSVTVYNTYIQLKQGSSIYMIPKSETIATWSLHDVLVNNFNALSENGTTYEIDRKALLSGLNLVSCILSKTDKDAWRVAFEYEKDTLVVRNILGTAATKIPATVDGSFDEEMYFSIELLRDILNSMEGENVLMTLNTLENGHGIHFEEQTEQIILLGLTDTK